MIPSLVTTAVGLAAGLLAIGVGPSFRTPLLWVPDLVTGIAIFVLAGVAWPRHRRLAIIAIATGLLWFAGSVWAVAVFWHRGPLVHLLLAYPAGRAPDRTTRAAIVAGYLAAAVPWVWGTDAAAVPLAAFVVALTVLRRCRARGRERAAATLALITAALLAAAVLAGAVARMLAGPVETALVVLLFYELVLVAAVTVLGAGLTVPSRARVTDLVVDLAVRRDEPARAALARAVGDPTLVVGYGSAGTGGFVDDAGMPVRPSDGEERQSTVIDGDGRHTIVLVHQAGVLDDPGLREAVARAAQLGAENARRQAGVRADLDAVGASRRRLLTASDDERRRLADEIVARVRGPLHDLGARLDDAVEELPSLRRAGALIEDATRRIDEAIAGLQPPELRHGLVQALHALADRSPIGVTVTGAARRREPDVETAAYYVCAEAVTNTTKHSPGAGVRIDIADEAGRLIVTVTDNGPGGADIAAGTGLRGIADRVAAVGGTLTLASPPRTGITLVAAFADRA